MTNIDMAHFAQALYMAHEYNAAVVSPAARAEAESLLIALKESPDGYALACNILAAEPFDQLRAFWAFNTLIHHINAVSSSYVASAITNPAQADELYAVLTAWIRRVVVERALPDFILNKHAQTVVIGAYAFYPNNWCTFFDDLFEFNDVRERGGGDQVAFYFLRVFEYIDEVVVDRHSQRSPAQRERDMAIKDVMREVAVRRAVDVWYNILTYYHNRPPAGGLECAQLCLRVLEAYVEWIDVSLLLTPYWVNLLYFLMSVHPLRVGACECLGQLVAKKQTPQIKVETLTALNVVEALSMLAPLVTSQLPTTEEEEQFTLSVAWLMLSAAEHLMTCVEQQQPGAAQMLQLVIPHVLSLLNIPLFSVRDSTLPFIQSYCKWAPPDELQAVMEAVFLQTCRPAVPGPLTCDEDGADGSWCDEISDARRRRHAAASGGIGGSSFAGPSPSVGGCISEVAAVSNSLEERNLEQRKQLHNALRQIYRRNAPLVVSHCMYALDAVLSNPSPCEVSEGDAEGAVRYLYELGETVKMDTLRPAADGQPANDFVTMLTGLLVSRLVREHPSPALHLAVFETCDRYFVYFVHHRDYVGTLLELLLQGGNGILNPSPRVRGRICYLFSHLVQNLKNQMVPYTEAIFNALSGVLSPDEANGPLLPSDKADLYEALGSLLSAAHELGKCQQVLEQILIYSGRIVQEMGSSPSSSHHGSSGRSATPNAASESAARVVADCIFYLTRLAKGVGGIEATRMPDSPPLQPTAPPGVLAAGQPGGETPGDAALLESDTAIAAALEATRQDPSAAVFLSILEHVVSISEQCLAYPAVREKTLNFLQQFLNILGVASLPSIELLLPAMIRTTSIAECARILRVLYQTVNKTKAAVSSVMGRTLLPLIMERVAGFGHIHDLRALHNVISESARELAEVYRQYFGFVQTLVHGPSIASLMHPSMQAMLGVLMEQLLAAIRTPPEAELAKPSLGAITRLTSAWCDPDTTFEAFLFDSILPTAIDEFTNGAVDVRSDAKVLVLIGEFCSLLRAFVSKLGDRGLFRLYSVLTGSNWVSHSEANGFCATVREQLSARTNIELRRQTKALLELIVSRRAQGATVAGT